MPLAETCTDEAWCLHHSVSADRAWQGLAADFLSVAPKGTVEGELSLFSLWEYGPAALVSAPGTHFTVRSEIPLVSKHPH